ncbi:MAG TPA: DMT family transporter [Candidatus Bathyarchaeia archaeon]|nr:DMT family transporter [Candidatus Bathyarchaeia archaeon]
MARNRLISYFLLILTAILWGFAAPIVKYTLSYIDPVSFLFYRFTIVCLIFLIPFIMAIKKVRFSSIQLIKLTIIGILGGPVTLLLIFWGADKTTSLDASIIVAMAPILIVIAGATFLKERVTVQEKVGLLIAMLGTLITVLQPLVQGNFLARQHLVGNLLVFFSNIAWAAYSIMVKKSSSRFSPLILTSITFFSGLLILPFLFLYQRLDLINWQRSVSLPTSLFFEIHPKAIPGILYMSLFSSVIAYTTYNWGISLIEASEATLFTYLQPIFAAPLAFFWLKEEVTAGFLIGAFLIAIGIFLTEFRKEKKELYFEDLRSN